VKSCIQAFPLTESTDEFTPACALQPRSTDAGALDRRFLLGDGGVLLLVGSPNVDATPTSPSLENLESTSGLRTQGSSQFGRGSEVTERERRSMARLRPTTSSGISLEAKAAIKSALHNKEMSERSRLRLQVEMCPYVRPGISLRGCTRPYRERFCKLQHLIASLSVPGRGAGSVEPRQEQAPDEERSQALNACTCRDQWGLWKKGRCDACHSWFREGRKAASESLDVFSILEFCTVHDASVTRAHSSTSHRIGAFEVFLTWRRAADSGHAGDEEEEEEERRITLFSKLRRGSFPNLEALVSELVELLPRVVGARKLAEACGKASLLAGQLRMERERASSLEQRWAAHEVVVMRDAHDVYREH
jgi:hypothetical protein